MIIQCGRCSRKFKIDDSRIKPEGSNVRCSRCGHIFVVKSTDQVTGSDPLTELPEKGPQTGINQDINIERPPVENNVDDGMSDVSAAKSAEIGQEETGHPAEDPLGHERDIADEEMLDIELDKTPKDGGNWEEFASISKTGDQARDIETEERAVDDREQNEFNWENLSIEEESGVSDTDIPEMFEDDEGMSEEAPVEESDSQEKSESHGYESQRSSAQELTLDTDSPDRYQDSEVDFGRLEQNTIHHRADIYGSQKKSKRSAIGKIAYTLMIAAVFVVIVIASLTILINLELIPEENVTKAKTFVESILPVKITPEETRDIVITQHGGSWMNTRYGPLYVISGMIKNVSDRPIHYIKIRSEFISAGQTLYEDTIYAGNTFTENELKVSKIEDIVFKLKKKNGDIDYYDMKKLSGLNYNIQPGESIPFFAVFPNDRTVLGLKYNLQVVNYEDSVVN